MYPTTLLYDFGCAWDEREEGVERVGEGEGEGEGEEEGEGDVVLAAIQRQVFVVLANLVDPQQRELYKATSLQREVIGPAVGEE